MVYGVGHAKSHSTMLFCLLYSGVGSELCASDSPDGVAGRIFYADRPLCRQDVMRKEYAKRILCTEDVLRRDDVVGRQDVP